MSVWGQANDAAHAMARQLGDRVPPMLRQTLELNLFGLRQVPMILYCRPRVVRLDAEACEVLVPLRWRTRNHLGSMYFGALAVGADVAGGFLARHHIERQAAPIDLIFKTFSAEFLRRPTGDVLTRCAAGTALSALAKQAAETGTRVEQTVDLEATVPAASAEAVARFRLQISLKVRGRH